MVLICPPSLVASVAGLVKSDVSSAGSSDTTCVLVGSTGSVPAFIDAVFGELDGWFSVVTRKNDCILRRLSYLSESELPSEPSSGLVAK